MRAFFHLALGILILGIQLTGHTQDIELSGKIIDKQTQKPIPFANIALKELYKGTACNSLGEFSFKIDSLPVTLTISHLSYEPFELEVTENQPLVIELIAGKLLMDELVIKAKGNDQYAYNLIEKAYYRLQSRLNREHHGKAFYRQISRNGDEYSELYEIFYDTKFSSNGVEDWAIQEGRYALKLSTADSFIYNKNFTLMVRLLTIVQPRTDDLVVPVSEDVRENFYVIADQILSVNNRKVAQIRFEKHESVDKPTMEGEIWIDTDSYEVLKLVGQIEDDDLNFITLKGKSGSWKNYKVTCEIAFKPLEDDELAMDYIRLGQNFDYFVDGTFANKVETRSFFTYYEYYKPPKKKKLGGRLIRFRDRDSEVLDNIGYNQQFWDDNIIVKRTPVEAEVINDFEEERAFGSIYLNNRDQIVLDDFQLDSDEYIIFVKDQLAELDLPRKGEKVYVHRDKPYYVTGERMWFKSYIVNMATNQLTERDGVLYLELFAPNGNRVASNMYPVRNGKCDGYLELPSDLPSGAYRLSSYTDRMQGTGRHYYFSDELQILSGDQEPATVAHTVQAPGNSLQFFAEGGRMIGGMPAQVGYHAMDRFGNPLEIKGKMVNDEGRLIANIKSEYDGFGSLFVLPNPDAGFNLMISSDEVETDPFPEIEGEGYTMMVNNLKPNTIDVTIRGSVKLEGQKIYVLVISNGVLFDRRIGMLTRGLYKCEIPKTNLPSSITQLLLVNEEGEVLCKRLVYPNQYENISARYFMAKNEFRRRDRIDLVIDLRNENGKPVRNANISVSVLDSDKLTRVANTRNIRSYLGLEHALDYKLKDPGLIFEDFDRESLKRIDWVMLTQQSVTPDFATMEVQQKLVEKDPELARSLSIRGIARVGETKSPLVNGFLSFVKKGDPAGFCRYVKTDDEGTFTIEGVEFSGKIEVLVLGYDSSGEMVDINIEYPGDPMAEQLYETEQLEVSSEVKKYVSQFRKTQNELGVQQDDPPAKVVMAPFPSQFGTSTRTHVMDVRRNSEENLLDVIRSQIQEVAIVENASQTTITFVRNDQEPIILLDGFILFAPENEHKADPIDLQSFAIVKSDVKSALQNLSSDLIGKIELFETGNLDGPSGSISQNGIIALYSRAGMDPFTKEISGSIFNTEITGFAASDKFYSPQYTRSSNANNDTFVPDVRSTLHWEPHITTNRKGRAKVGFYNSDDARNFQICVEGITSEGVPIFDIYEFGRNVNRGQVN